MILLKAARCFSLKLGKWSTCADDVIKFWFAGSQAENTKLWFGGGEEVDKLIREKFGNLVLKATNGQLGNWENLSCGKEHGMAFIILIDQFCRNIYRGSADAFIHDHKARAVVSKMLLNGMYKELPYSQRSFFLLPLMHHEDMKSQDLSVKLYEELYEETKGSENEQFASVGFAKEHREVIQAFGRFPKRNAALKRENTPEETDALKDWKYGF